MMVPMGLVAVLATALFRPPAALAFSSSSIKRLPSALGRVTAVTGAVSSALQAKQQQQNSFSSLIGDMASFLGGKDVKAKVDSIDDTLIQLGPSWKTLRSSLESQQTNKEKREFRTNLENGYGVGSPLHKVRLFDESNKEQDIRVTFYRDSASWCPYCQKVWLTLEEKRIPYRVEKINMRCYGDKPSWFNAMQPSGQIPVAKIDGKVYGQSNDILYQLEELFSNDEHKSLRGPENQRMRAQELLRLERELFSAWMYWLTSGGGDPKRFRAMFTETLNRVESALNDGPFFLGKQVSMVDFQFAPFLERMAASLLYFKGFQIRVAPGESTDFPAVNKWFDAMETLPSYQLTKSDYYTHCWDLPPQLGGCVSDPDGKAYERAINGERSLDGSQGSWEFPLQRHNGGVEPDWDWAAVDPATARREAVERVTANSEAIVQFAARGAGRKGMPPVSAPLADPNATPSESVQGAVSAVLRVVCDALLEEEGESITEKHDAIMTEISQTIVKEGGDEFASAVVSSMSYLRDRIGVPRDMKLPAARQLRAALNWSIGKILDAQQQ